MNDTYLFIDSSLCIQVGLLDADLNWLHYEYVPNQKGSTVLHSIIYSVLEEAGLKILDLKGLIIANGPGSYTGIRLTEGISQISEAEGISVCSFYHFEVPFFCGISNYKFYANAFKGEIFEYSFKGKDEVNISMLKKDTFLSRSFDEDNFFHINGELEGKYLSSTTELIKENSLKLFTKVINRKRHSDPYYFRSLEKEFKPSFN
jgi:tRNA threonylcarbamoyladenosine biosynthesis protein TsaB